MLPSLGANLISFRDVVNDWRFLREPQVEEVPSFKEKPNTFGIPVLFPPNRYADGRFTVAGETYQFPINEPARNNFIHGFFFRLPWSVQLIAHTHKAAYVVLQQQVGEGHPLYAYFPHRFTMSLAYTLSASGLRQWVRIHNQGVTPMPAMLGFHTAFAVPFDSAGRPADYQVQVDLGARLDLNERGLPTGVTVPLTNAERAMQESGASPFYAVLDNHYFAHPVGERHGMQVINGRSGVKLVYTVDRQYRFWMLWNGGAQGSFFCAEPQTNMVNAPNVPWPRDKKGLVVLKRGESFRAGQEWRVARVIFARDRGKNEVAGSRASDSSADSRDSKNIVQTIVNGFTIGLSSRGLSEGCDT